MQPTRDIEHYLAHLPIELQDIVLELRSIIASVAPTATETIHRKGFTYYYAERGGPVSAGICQINLQRDHIRLALLPQISIHDRSRRLMEFHIQNSSVHSLAAYAKPLTAFQLITFKCASDP